MKEQVFFRAFDDVIDKSDDAQSDDGGIIKVRFVISTPRKDRARDTISVDGWDTKNFEKNPVVLWAHDKSLPPIAKANRVWVKGKKLLSDAEFTPPDYSHPLCDGFGNTIGRMYKNGFLNTVSVGFSAKKWRERQDGVDFDEQELLEYSSVPLPMNPDALAVARGMGIDTKPIYRWCEHSLDHRLSSLPPSTVSNELVLETYKSLKREHAPTLMQRIFRHEKKKDKKMEELEELKSCIKGLTEAINGREEPEDHSGELIGLVKELAGSVKSLSDEVKELKEKQAAAPTPTPEPEPQSDDDDFDLDVVRSVLADTVASAVADEFKALE